MTGIMFILKRAFYFVVDNWRLFAILAGLLVLILLVVFAYRGCTRRDVKIDQETVQKVNSQNRREREAELQKVIEENQTVIQTVDNRSAVAETNVVERNAEIDRKVKEVDAKIQAAKQQGRDVTEQELKCLLIPENCS